MSLINKKELEKNKWELEFSIPSDDFKVGLTKAYKKNIKNINVQGFRKGKAPQAIVERLYGQDVFFNDAIDIVLPEAYTKVVDEFSLDIVSRPEIAVKSASKDEGVVITAIVYTRPEIDIKEYKNLNVDKIVKPVTDEDVDKNIEETRKRNSRTITIEDRKTQMGDIAIIDFEGFCDGKAFDGGKGENFSLTLGEGQFIKGFEEQLVGFNANDEVEVNVTFPSDYHSKDLAGKDSLFKVKINEIKSVELPDLDDEFAKDISEFDTLKDYKNSVKENIQKERNNSADKEVETKLVTILADNVEGDIPEVMYDMAAEEELNKFADYLKNQGLAIETYLQYTGQSIDMLRATYKEQAIKLVKSRLALSKIVKLENIIPTEKEIEEEYEKLSKSYNMSVDDIKKYMTEDRLKEELALEKAVTFVKENAKITEKEEVKEEKPKKKATVKKAVKDNDDEKSKKKATVKKAVKENDDEKPKKKATVKKSEKESDNEKPKKIKRTTKKDEN